MMKRSSLESGVDSFSKWSSVSSKIKIAVYSIALNEEKHVKRWFESAKDADLVLIADTGSKDKTRSVASTLGVTVHQINVTPWRFDVARNASLALIPEDFDICIQLDLDEVLIEGWRVKVEAAWLAGNKWPSYKHVTARNTDGTARAFQHYFKIHPRKGFAWKYPIHEVVGPIDGQHFSRELIDLEVEHLQDHEKPRNSYLLLLEMAVAEMPSDWRMNHYLGREYYYNQNWIKVLETAYKSLGLKVGWNVEAASTAMWASEAAWSLGFKPLAEEWAERGTSAAPDFYEVWHWRAHIAHLLNKWQDCFDAASKINVLKRQSHHLVKPAVWEWWGFDLMALSLHHLGFHDHAFHYGEIACDFAPDIDRLAENLEWYELSLNKMVSGKYESVQKFGKLRNFPPIYVLNLRESRERLENFKNGMQKWGLNNFSVIQSDRPHSSLGIVSRTNLDLSVHLSLLQSQKRALTSFLDSGADYGVICEDDVNWDSCELWKFRWESKFENYKKMTFDAIQLSLVTGRPEFFEPRFHRRIEGFDWSSGITLWSRAGAQKIIAKLNSVEIDIPIKSQLYDGLKIYVEPLFLCNATEISTINQSHVELSHRHSWRLLSDYFIKNNIEKYPNITFRDEVNLEC